MKILIATDCYIHNTGGITASVLALCAGLRRAGHEVRTLSLSGGRRSCREGTDYFIRSFPAFYYPGMRMSFAVRDPLIRELEAWKPDVIHLQTEGSARRMARRIGKRCGAPVVQTCHTYYGYFVFGRFCSLPPARALETLAGWFLTRGAAKVTVPSRKAAGFPFVRAARKRLSVIPNGMEAEKYRNRFSPEERQAFRRSLGIGDGEKVLVTATRLSREKNIRELISFLPGVADRTDGVKLLIAGDGPDRKRLERTVRSLRLDGRVIFTGRVPPEDVWRVYAAGDVYVSASVFEVHSMSHLEAMAGGLPLLCRADDALEGVLEHGVNGLIYRSREEFTDFACRLLGDDRFRAEAGRRSAQRAESFSVDAFAASFIRLYGETLREHAGKKHRKDGYPDE